MILWECRSVQSQHCTIKTRCLGGVKKKDDVDEKGELENVGVLVGVFRIQFNKNGPFQKALRWNDYLVFC